MNACTCLFYEKVFGCLDRPIPKRVEKRGTYRGINYPVYFSLALKKNIKLKNHLHRKIKKGKATLQVKNNYKNLRTTVKYQTAQEFQAYHETIENNVNIDPSSFWDFVRSKRAKPGIPSEVCYEGCTVSGAQEVADTFALYFGSVFQQSEKPNNDGCNGNFTFSPITEEQIMASIKRLKPKKATGNDNIPSYIYKGCSDVLCDPLMTLFNLCLKTGTFPEALKCAAVTPVFKSGDVSLVDNYRPISVLNSLAKIFENILYQDIMGFFVNDFSPQQHGFLPGVSTVTNLGILAEAAAKAIDSKEQLDVVLTDCAKAFDRVDHGLLVDKLGKFGFSLNACKLMTSYLIMRPQQVKVGKELSKQYIATSGVPQGSNLGPLLFSIFMNDLPDCIRHSQCLLFADDFKIFKHIASSNDCHELQYDLGLVFQWFNVNRMSLNIGKCHVLTFTRKIQCTNFDYMIDNMALSRESKCRDLGVCLQTNLKFVQHYETIVNKSYKLLGFVIRNTKHFKDVRTIITLYNALVRPNLEYASIIWAPQTMSHVDMIEKVQKRFLRYLYLRTHNVYPYMVSYNSMLIEFKMVKLSVRRSLNDVLFIYNIVNNLKYKKCSLINDILFLVPKINLRIRDNKLFQCLPLNSSPINRMMRECNMFIQKCDIDLFNTTVGQIKSIILNNDTFW